MATITGVVKSPIKGKTGTLKRSSGYEYRDFYYVNANGVKVHVVGWHRAVDITTTGTIVAFARGKVVSVVKGVKGQTTNPSGGNSVELLHANGVKTKYCHLDNGSNNHLKVGDIVEEGAVLGTDTIKTTGNSTGLHLHFAVYDPNNTYKSSHYMNPIDYLQGKRTIQGYSEPSDWTTGTYITLKEKYIRTSPKVANNKVKYSKLLPEAKLKAKMDSKGYAKYKIGVEVNITAFETDSKGNLWGKTINTWLCLKDSTGNQVRKK